MDSRRHMLVPLLGWGKGATMAFHFEGCLPAAATHVDCTAKKRFHSSAARGGGGGVCGSTPLHVLLAASVTLASNGVDKRGLLVPLYCLLFFNLFSFGGGGWLGLEMSWLLAAWRWCLCPLPFPVAWVACVAGCESVQSVAASVCKEDATIGCVVPAIGVQALQNHSGTVCPDLFSL